MDERQILQCLSDNNGIIFTNDAEAHGITRFRLSYLARKNKIDHVGHGMYALKHEIIDDYAMIQKMSSRIIFSHQTALYFHNLSDRVPSDIHITVPQGYNASRLKKRYDQLIVHYAKKELFELGKTHDNTFLGDDIIIYDKERCICDLVRDCDTIDSQFFTEALRRYFVQPGVDIRKLITYAQQMNVEPTIRRYIEVLS